MVRQGTAPKGKHTVRDARGNHLIDVCRLTLLPVPFPRCLRARASQDWGPQGAISCPVQGGTSDQTLLEASFRTNKARPRGGRHELRLFGSHGQNLPDKLHDAVRAFYKMRFCCRRFFTAIRMAAVRIFTDKSDPKHRPNGLLCHRYFCKIEKRCCMCFSLFAAPAFSKSQVLLVSHHTDRANSGYRSVYVSSRWTKSAVI